MILNMPLRFPSGMIPVRRSLEVQSGFLLNVDGLPVPYDPYVGLCNMNNLEEVVANPALRGLTYHLGGIATAPRIYA